MNLFPSMKHTNLYAKEEKNQSSLTLVQASFFYQMNDIQHLFLELCGFWNGESGKENSGIPLYLTT